MSKADIIAELPKLTAEDRVEIQLRLEELAGEGWADAGELTNSDKELLDNRLADYEKNPEAGTSWEKVQSRLRSRLQQ
jgi:putative addiction module component (TIGR02574 family)